MGASASDAEGCCKRCNDSSPETEAVVEQYTALPPPNPLQVRSAQERSAQRKSRNAGGNDRIDNGVSLPVKSASAKELIRGSTKVRLPTTLDTDCRRIPLYPMYLTPVSVFLEMDAFIYHEALLDNGFLVQWQPGMEYKIIFVSHQWLAFEHPDPCNQQFEELKTLLTNLMNGKIEKVASSPMVPEHLRKEISSEEWAKTLPSMYLWIDYHSIPQRPEIVESDAEGRDSRHSRRNQRPSMSNPQSDEDDSDDAQTMRHFDSTVSWNPNGSGAKQTMAQLETNQARAIMSIPAYVERCSLFLVLSPVCSHLDVDEVCNYTSWRGRGWCRMELMSTIFACTEIPIMIFRGGAPQFMYPDDAVLLLPGQGQFTCCNRNHWIGDRQIQCDRHALFEVIRSMVLVKVDHLEETGHLVMKRFFVCTANWYLRGLITSRGNRASITSSLRSMRSQDSMSRGFEDSTSTLGTDRATITIDTLKQLTDALQWKGPLCAVAEEGWSLLAYVALSGHFFALAELMTEDDIDPNVQIAKDYPEISIRKHETPLHLAMRFAPWEIVEELLEMKADPYMVTDGFQPGIDALMAACVLDRVENVRQWLIRFPKWDLERRAGAPSSNSTALLFAATFGDVRNSETLKALLAARANHMALSTNGLSPLHWAAANANASTTSVEILLKARADINARVVNKTGKGLPPGMAGATPLHSAVMRGNCGIIRKLMQLRADPSMTNDDGLTPMEQAKKTYPKGIPGAIVKSMSHSSV